MIMLPLNIFLLSASASIPLLMSEVDFIIDSRDCASPQIITRVWTNNVALIFGLNHIVSSVAAGRSTPRSALGSGPSGDVDNYDRLFGGGGTRGALASAGSKMVSRAPFCC